MPNFFALVRFKDAWSFASAVDNTEIWNELGTAALQHLEVDLAIRAFQQVKNVAMVYSLQQIQVSIHV